MDKVQTHLFNFLTLSLPTWVPHSILPGLETTVMKQRPTGVALSSQIDLFLLDCLILRLNTL